MRSPLNGNRYLSGLEIIPPVTGTGIAATMRALLILFDEYIPGGLLAAGIALVSALGLFGIGIEGAFHLGHQTAIQVVTELTQHKLDIGQRDLAELIAHHDTGGREHIDLVDAIQFADSQGG